MKTTKRKAFFKINFLILMSIFVLNTGRPLSAKADDFQVRCYQIHPKEYEFESLRNILMGDDPGTSENSLPEDNIYIASNTSGKMLYVSDGGIYYEDSPSAAGVRKIIFEFILSPLSIGGGAWQSDKNEVIKTNAVRKAADCISSYFQLGTDEKLYLVDAVQYTKEELMELQSQLKDSYGEAWEDVTDWEAKRYTGLRYGIKKNGCPLLNQAEPTQEYYIDINGVRPLSIQALLGDDELICFTIENAFETVTSEAAEIITKEQAYDIVLQEDAEIISDIKWNIGQPELEYVPIPDWTQEISMGVELRPYWCMRKTAEGYDYSTVVRINAITGGNLAYGE